MDDINIKRVLTDISTSLIPRLRSDLKPYGLDVDWQINSGIVTINVNEKGKKLYKSKADVKKNAKNFTFAIIDILDEYNLSVTEVLGMLTVTIGMLTKDQDRAELDAVITRLVLIKYDRLGILDVHKKMKTKDFV